MAQAHWDVAMAESGMKGVAAVEEEGTAVVVAEAMAVAAAPMVGRLTVSAWAVAYEEAHEAAWERPAHSPRRKQRQHAGAIQDLLR